MKVAELKQKPNEKLVSELKRLLEEAESGEATAALVLKLTQKNGYEAEVAFCSVGRMDIGQIIQAFELWKLDTLGAVTR